MCQCPLRLVTVVPIADVIETIAPDRSGRWLTSLVKNVLIFLLRHCVTVSTSDAVLKFFFLCAFEQGKHHPHLRSSTWRGYLRRFGFLSLSEDW
jgi:hypothetical protein